MFVRRKFHSFWGPTDGENVPSGKDVVGTENDKRLAMLDAINDRNDEINAEELANVNDDGTTEPFVPEKKAVTEGPEDEETPPEDEETPPEEAPPEEKEPDVQKFKIKVNGKEIELTQEELIARAQKVESADEYLAEAKKARKVEPEAPKGPTAEELQRQQDEEDLALVRAIQMGTEPEAAAAIRKIREQVSSRPSVTADDMSRAIDERLAFNEAITSFRKDYSDITEDPLLYQLANRRDNELLNSGDKRSYTERYKQIGDELRAWKDGLAGKGKEPEKDPSLDAKDGKKKAAPKVPSAANKKVETQKDDEDGEEDPREVIAQIAKSRGGPQWMR